MTIDDGTEHLVEPEAADDDHGYDATPETTAPDDAHTVLDGHLGQGIDGVTDQVDTTASNDDALQSLLDAAPANDDLGVVVPDGYVDATGIVEAWADWDGALLLELPYTDLPAAEQVAQISIDLAAARDAVRTARHQLLTDTSPHLHVAMPMLVAMRTRADELRPVAALDAAAHELWIDAEHAVEAAENVAAGLQHALTAATDGTGIRAGMVDELTTQLASARDLVAYTRQERDTRRTEFDTAHGALLAAAGPGGVITGADVDQARLTADGLDTHALTERRDTVRALEGALVRAESRVAHEYARTQTALQPTPLQATATVSTDGTDDRSARAGSTVVLDSPTRGKADAGATPRSAVPGATVSAPAEPGWRRLLGPRPADPALLAQWEQTISAVSAYRAAYDITTTNPLTPLGTAPSGGSDQAPVYRAVTKQWRTTMTSTDPSTRAAGDAPSAVATRLAEVERRLAHLRELREIRRDHHTEDAVLTQDGITDAHGYGHDTGYNATEQNRRSGMGY
jgi:hypothetical protein